MSTISPCLNSNMKTDLTSTRVRYKHNIIYKSVGHILIFVFMEFCMKLREYYTKFFEFEK